MKKRFLDYLYSYTRKLLLLSGITVGAIAFGSRSTLAAERLRFNYGPLGFSLSIDSLELYAKEGKINSELNFYTKRLDEKTVKQLRRILRRRINIDPILLYRLSRSPMVTEIIEGLGEVATTHYGHNGFYAIRGSLTNAAIENQNRGVSLIDVLRAFPSEDILLNIDRVFELRDELTTLVEYREEIRKLVVQQAKKESNLNQVNSFLPLKDLRTAGGIAFSKQTIEIDGRIADKKVGIRSREPFRVRLYLPQGLSQPAPIVFLSHGFGSEPRAFDYLGEHLASYGIAAVSVEHIGSDSDYELEFLEGAKKRAIAPEEFIERPLDIQYVIDELERRNLNDPALKGTLDLNKIGVIGHSLGGYTTLALAGAEINLDRLRQQCPNKKINLNISLLMQCRAKNLEVESQLGDSRIKGAIAISPIASGIFGPESLSEISIPTAIISGSEDIIAPVVQEQVYPFTWLSTEDKYLATIVPGDHFSGSSLPREKPDNPTIIEEFVGKRIGDGQPYIKAFVVAFVKVHIEGDSEYLPYLDASYAQNISNEQLDFSVIRSLDLESLEREYSDILPVILPTLEPSEE